MKIDETTSKEIFLQFTKSTSKINSPATNGIYTLKQMEVNMKTTLFSAMFLVALTLACFTEKVQAQAKVIPDAVAFAERNLSGPRLGVTYVYNGVLVDRLKNKGIGTFISQFGWHFEYQIIPEGGGPSFVIQGVPFIGGVEYGTLIPSGTVAMGVRLPDGIEFGMGPNIILGGDKGLTTSLVIAVGKSFNYGGVSIPINFAIATSTEGNRFGFTFGYAIAK